MIFNIYILIFLKIFLFCKSEMGADEKYEGLIVSVDSEAITTYDLSERIKLVLKSLKLEDNIKNRDSVRDRVLELLILEKIKKIESKKYNIEISDSEIKNFISEVYDFPVEEFEKFIVFLEQEGIDIDVVKEQLEAELLWTKFTRQRFSSKITINKNEVDRLADNLTNRVGKIEYNFSEMFFNNIKENDWDSTKKRMNKVISLLESDSPFDLIAKQFDENTSTTNLEKNRWILEDNLDNDQKKILEDMNDGEIKFNIKSKNGYKIIKLNRKRVFGLSAFSFSFIKFSSFTEDLTKLKAQNIKCDFNEDLVDLNNISFIKLSNIKANEISDVFMEEIKKTQIDSFSNTIEVAGENNVLLICDKSNKTTNLINREKIETKIFSEKFNQLSNTYLTNLRKNINVKFFTE